MWISAPFRLALLTGIVAIAAVGVQGRRGRGSRRQCVYAAEGPISRPTAGGGLTKYVKR